MAKIEMEMKITDFEELKAFFEIVAMNFDGLPSQVQDAVLDMAHGGVFYVDRDELVRRGFYNLTEGSSVGGSPVVSANSILRRVKVFSDEKKSVDYIYPDHYKLACGDSVIMEW